MSAAQATRLKRVSVTVYDVTLCKPLSIAARGRPAHQCRAHPTTPDHEISPHHHIRNRRHLPPRALFVAVCTAERREPPKQVQRPPLPTCLAVARVHGLVRLLFMLLHECRCTKVAITALHAPAAPGHVFNAPTQHAIDPCNGHTFPAPLAWPDVASDAGSFVGRNPYRRHSLICTQGTIGSGTPCRLPLPTVYHM